MGLVYMIFNGFLVFIFYNFDFMVCLVIEGRFFIYLLSRRNFLVFWLEIMYFYIRLNGKSMLK